MVLDFDPMTVVQLDDERALDASRVGAKAANLARAARAGLPVLAGFVIASGQRADGEDLRDTWRELSADGTRSLVVRSSSTFEDTGESSMAGRFESVLDVRGWESFLQAVRTVLDSAREVAEATRAPAGAHPMAVLVQPMLRAAAGGVMFGADPVEGREDRILVSAVRGGPDQLVDGSTQGTRYQFTPAGRLVRVEPRQPPGERPLNRRQLWRLARLARRTRDVFGGPQDIEFGFDTAGKLWLFQARPITAMAPRAERGVRLLGPGPVAETFPDVLQPLEEDLWVAPMSHGLTLALDIARAAPRRLLRTLPVVTTVEGRAAADLELLGAVPSRHPVLNFINPAPGARRASAAWRVGRLTAALPSLALDLMADTDRHLADFPPPAEMLTGQLLNAVSWGRAVLSALHAQESLAGALLGPGSGVTGASEALAVLAEGRRLGVDERELVPRQPVLLALTPPSIAGCTPLRLPSRTGWTGVPRGVGALPVREGLRLRIRWVQEMQARMVRELGTRLRATGGLDGPADIGLLRWSELLEHAETGVLPADFGERAVRPDSPPLPAAFRLLDGRPVAERARAAAAEQGQGAGGGFGTGIAWDGSEAAGRPDRPVLIVRTLDPALATMLPGLGGLVAETGSALSHLAVLAREYRVPTAVGVPDALERFPPGTPVAVDGATGAVTVLPDGPRPADGDSGTGGGSGSATGAMA